MNKYLIALIAIAFSSQIAHADTNDIKTRQQYMKDWRGISKKMGDILKNSNAQTFPNAEFATLANQLATTAHEPWKHYTAGSIGDAKAEVWTQPQAFQAAIKQFNDATLALAQAAKTNDYPTVKTAFGQVGQSCKTCHKSFKD